MNLSSFSKVQLSLVTILAIGLSYVFASLAIDRGSLIQYAVAIALFIVAIKAAYRVIISKGNR